MNERRYSCSSSFEAWRHKFKRMGDAEMIESTPIVDDVNHFLGNLSEIEWFSSICENLITNAILSGLRWISSRMITFHVTFKKRYDYRMVLSKTELLIYKYVLSNVCNDMQVEIRFEKFHSDGSISAFVSHMSLIESMNCTSQTSCSRSYKRRKASVRHGLRGDDRFTLETSYCEATSSPLDFQSGGNPLSASASDSLVKATPTITSKSKSRSDFKRSTSTAREFDNEICSALSQDEEENLDTKNKRKNKGILPRRVSVLFSSDGPKRSTNTASTESKSPTTTNSRSRPTSPHDQLK